MSTMQSKFWRIALSAVIALALWVYVITTVNPESEETFYDIPVSYQNDVLEERGLMIVSEKPTVTLKLKGNRSDLNELDANNITILVNLAAIQAPGTQMVKYDVSYPANLPSNAFETLSQTPNLLKLKVENKIKKFVPIQLEYTGNVPEGFVDDRENPLMDTNVIEVSGPESSVDQIDHAVIQVDLTDRTESVVGAYSYVLCDAGGEPVDAQMVTTNVEEVNLSVKIQRLKEVPLVLNLVDGGGATGDTCKVTLDVESIWVAGTENKLRDLNEVELGTVNLAELKDETNELTFQIVLPEGVTNINDVTEVTATISFPDLAKKKITISKEQFLSAGVPAGAEVIWVTDVVEIELRGPKDLIRSISEKDIVVTMDFSGEEMGSVNKVPRITMSGTYSEVGTISISSVIATLQLGEDDAANG